MNYHELHLHFFVVHTYIVIEWCIVALYIILHRSPEPPLLRLVTMNCYESVIWPSSPIVQTPSNQNCRTFHPDKFIRFCWMMSIFRTNLVLAASKFREFSRLVRGSSGTMLFFQLFFRTSQQQIPLRLFWSWLSRGAGWHTRYPGDGAAATFGAPFCLFFWGGLGGPENHW